MPVLAMPRGYHAPLWVESQTYAELIQVMREEFGGGIPTALEAWRLARESYEDRAAELALSEYRGEPGTPVFYRGIA